MKRKKSPEKKLKKEYENDENKKKRSKSPNENLKDEKYKKTFNKNVSHFIDDLESCQKNYAEYKFNQMSILNPNIINNRYESISFYNEERDEMKFNKSSKSDDSDKYLPFHSTDKNSEKKEMDQPMEIDDNDEDNSFKQCSKKSIFLGEISEDSNESKSITLLNKKKKEMNLNGKKSLMLYKANISLT